MPEANETVTAAELGKWLGLSARAIRSLADEGRVVRANRPARYLLQESVAKYAEYIRGVAAGRGGSEGVANLTAERARLAREQADLASLRAAQMRGELVSASEVQARWTAILTALRAAMLAIPSRVHARLPSLSRQEVEILESEIREALHECSHPVE